MDLSTFHYQPGKDQLQYVDDGVAPSLYANDIDDQAPGNYAYDKVGNLIEDKQAKMQIRWTDYGKVKEIDTLIQSNPSAILPKLIFKYDATGNRLEREYTGHYKDIYLRDPQGNVMAVYRIRKDSLFLTELPMYGEKRLGVIKENRFLMKKPTQNSIATPVIVTASKPPVKTSIYTLGKKHYETTDRLGNVRVTYTDKKSWSNGKFALNVSSSQDYYPFGAIMEGRKYNLSAYRYAFNTQERVPELNENHYTALYWEYDGRLARRWNRDPQWQRIPEQSPYSVNNNNPIQYTDPDGEIGIIGAAIGAVVGAVVEVGSQVVSNVAQGKPAFKNIDWADVVISAGEGALVGSGVGLATVVVGQTVGAFAKAAVDFTSEDKLEVVGGDKDLGEAGIDLASNLIGNTIGRFGLGDAISKNVIRGLSKGSPGTGNIFGKLLVGKTVGGLTEGVITGGISGGLKMLKSEADFRKALREGILLNEVEIVGDKKTETYPNVDKQFKSEMEKKNPGFLKGLFRRNKKEE